MKEFCVCIREYYNKRYFVFSCKKKEMTEDVDGIDLDVATPRRSPSGVTFEACDRELFMKNLRSAFLGFIPI